MAEAQRRDSSPVFDRHLHIIDPRCPLLANDGYLPRPLAPAGGAGIMEHCLAVLSPPRCQEELMPVEVQVLGYAALLQFVQFIVMAVPVNIQLGTDYTAGNRDEERRPTGVPGRLKRAVDNHTEALVLFTIAVVVVALGNGSTPLTAAAAWAYLGARILYVPAYASGVFLLRSLIWAVGFFATALMLVVGLFG